MSPAEKAPRGPAHRGAPSPEGSCAPALSAVLPCFEEAENLRAVVTALGHAARALGIEPLEVLLVCDTRARDGTPAVAHALAAGAEAYALRVLMQSAEARASRGYGGAVRLGLAAARAPWVLILDADGQFDPGELVRLWCRRGERRAVLGVRTERRDARARHLASRLYRACARFAVPEVAHVTDPDCAFKLLPRAALAGADLVATSGAVNLEILARLAAHGCDFVEVPVSHHPRRAGTARFEWANGLLAGMPRPSAALEMLSDVVRIGWRRRRASGATPT